MVVFFFTYAQHEDEEVVVVAVLEVAEEATEVCHPVAVAADHTSRLRIAVHFKTHKTHSTTLSQISVHYDVIVKTY